MGRCWTINTNSNLNEADLPAGTALIVHLGQIPFRLSQREQLSGQLIQSSIWLLAELTKRRIAEERQATSDTWTGDVAPERDPTYTGGGFFIFLARGAESYPRPTRAGCRKKKFPGAAYTGSETDDSG